MIDLHVHTTASDGQYSPTQIVEKAFEKGVKILAITDHDTVDGLDEGELAAKKAGIKFVRGTELSINYPTGEFHLLGLGLKETSSSLKELLDKVVENRRTRNLQIVKKMQDAGIDITLEELESDFPSKVIGRPHFAAELEKKKIVKNRQMAFDKYLAKGRPWYVEKVSSNLDEAIIAIRESGGAPVIAHPMSLYLSWGKLPDALQEIYDRGVVGLEAFHPGARNTDCYRLEEVAHKIGFFVTAGSDFHGEKIRADRKLGHACGGKKITEEYFQGLQEYLDKFLIE